MAKFIWVLVASTALLSACSMSGGKHPESILVQDQEAHRRIAEEFVRLAAQGNVNGLLASMASMTLSANDRGALESYLRDLIAPFFQGYNRLHWQGRYLQVKDGRGNKGVQYYEFIETDGESRPFVITFFPEAGSHRVSSIVVGECFRGYHSACP